MQAPNGYIKREVVKVQTHARMLDVSAEVEGKGYKHPETVWLKDLPQNVKDVMVSTFKAYFWAIYKDNRWHLREQAPRQEW